MQEIYPCTMDSCDLQRRYHYFINMNTTSMNIDNRPETKESLKNIISSNELKALAGLGGSVD